ncbi:hypothetical protein [Pontibacter fetidus]|uniref:Glycosyltransferase RgtA/B/C/D-like domain-containing protein n=1 Tax=Pontibacter fetidus TaxID=2700082 RepID=A0A6B2H865_9BACT|nr:hypothetical protein [Pontibacter fetidus]NDK56190.1 hypothetical protein [Pontibacter fetidus]
MMPLLYLLNVLLLLGLGLQLHKQAWAKALQPYMLPALGLKLLCGVLLGVLYFHYYGEGDTITYFNASQKLTQLAHENSGAYWRLLLFNQFPSETFRATVPFTQFADFSNSFFLLKVLSLFNLLTGSSYYLIGLYFSLFSFWGMARLAATLSFVFPDTKKAAILALLFFPSVVFWSSGLLKDAVLMGSMCWVMASVLQLAHGQKQTIVTWLLLPLQLYLFVKIKIFFAALLLSLLTCYLVLKVLSRTIKPLQALKVQLLILAGFMALAIVTVWQISGIFSFDFIAEQLFKTYKGLLALSLGRPHLHYSSLQPTLASIVLNAPKAFFSAIYRPFIGESSEVLYLLLGLENLLLAVLTTIAIVSASSKIWLQKIELWHIILVLFIVASAIVVGISTPNFGTLSRYRIIFLPFLVYLLLQNRFAQRQLAKLR